MKIKDVENYEKIISSEAPISKIPMKIGSNIIISYLVNEMYKNKKLIPVQEILSNALDIHKRTNQSRPIEVHLPTLTECFLSIKDFGTGLNPNPEEMSKFGDLGISDKNNSDDEAGGYGLGSKSPLAYVDSYLAISSYNGKKYTFSIEVDKSSWDFSINLRDVCDTDEQNGLEIVFSIDPNDIIEINKYYYRTVSFWDIKPLITNINDIDQSLYKDFLDLDTKKIQINDNLFFIHNQYVPRQLGDITYNQANVFFIISGIPYKCPPSLITDKMKKFSNNYSIFLKISTKTVKPATDRENISLTDYNKENIVSHFNTIYQTMVDYFKNSKEENNNNLTFTLDSAFNLYAKKSNLFPNTEELKNFSEDFIIPFKDKKINVNFSYNSISINNQKITLESLSLETKRYSSNLYLKNKGFYSSLHYHVDSLTSPSFNIDNFQEKISKNIFFKKDYTISKAKEKRIIEHYLRNSKSKNFKIFHFKSIKQYSKELIDLSEETIKELELICDFLNLQDLNSLPSPKIEKVAKVETGLEYYKISKHPFNSYKMNFNIEKNFLDLEAKEKNIFYLHTIKKGTKFFIGNSKLFNTHELIINLFNFCTKNNITLIGLTQKQIDNFKKQKVKINCIDSVFENIDDYPHFFNENIFNINYLIDKTYFSDCFIPNELQVFNKKAFPLIKKIKNNSLKDCIKKFNFLITLKDSVVNELNLGNDLNQKIATYLKSRIVKPKITSDDIKASIEHINDNFGFLKNINYSSIKDEDLIKLLELL